jgi:predicted dehydrogenase
MQAWGVDFRDDGQVLSRRGLVRAAALAAAGSVLAGGRAAEAEEPAGPAGSADRLRVAVMGVNGRGAALARGFAADPRAAITVLCDVDNRVAGPLAESLGKTGGTPRVEGDIRRVLDDRTIDVLVVAAPNHWHAPATILGCRAGKHVYVEKPCSHTPEEGELAVAAAREHRRVVTMGSQRRSWPALREAVELVRSGGIGEVRLARTWYAARRGSIGRKDRSPPPAWLDWTLWQGPAPDRPFKENIVHYNWHWHWHWGNGELGNNGVHAIDVARWGLAVDYPTHVTAGGGRLHFDDDQETPDTMSVSYTFPGGRMITWEGLSCVPAGLDGSGFGVWFVGSGGSLVIGGGGSWKRLDPKGGVVEERSGEAGDRAHIANFLDCVVSGDAPHADIAEAHRSTLLCHLGNIAWRTGGGLATRPEDGHISDAAVAGAFWGRDYRDGWAIRG